MIKKSIFYWNAFFMYPGTPGCHQFTTFAA